MSNPSPVETVVITGAAAGVGRATAHAFAGRGANVGLVARGREAPEAAKHEVEALGGRAIVAVADVADPDQVEVAAQTVEDVFRGIDVWGNDAMASVFSPVKQVKAEEYRRVTEVVDLGYVHGTLVAPSGRYRDTVGKSSRSARRWPARASRSNPPTAPRSTRSRASPSRYAASYSTTGATSRSRWCRCRL